ncbi:osmoprotectant transport system substrate-binding protein [Pseudonocardia ammonioxydans]|uniref:Osmoprotectant transport system substrate-binding protein n=1 Tax=Pseudonocardia ammonioxydans TaxID=260086 RepID=A0A1I4VPX1_PSUAM|nr:glycine betaine ABC transporter substrate-binding protein [Pseudonocardia ammonioxydans]SFN03361.1 osmoprotectant transport system substrate-binding protein [Pseudonocardia ammonioxydans]
MRFGRSRRIALTAIAAATAVALAGCGGLSGGGPSASGGSLAEAGNLEGVDYIVGGKNFDEQLVLCEVTVAALEAAGGNVTPRCNLGGTDVARQALLSGDINIYWDYTGTAWASFFKETQRIPDDNELYRLVAERDLQENQLVWLDKASFNNTYAFAMTEAKSQELGITTLSDMANHIRSGQPGSVCVETEYNSRDDGLRGLQETYDFQIPEGGTQVLATGVIYQATADGRCLFGEVFTTDGRIPGLKLKVLEDDKKYHVTYNAAPIVREETYNQNQAIREVMKPISDALDYETMLRLNGQVSSDGMDPRQVARDWMTEQGFIG